MSGEWSSDVCYSDLKKGYRKEKDVQRKNDIDVVDEINSYMGDNVKTKKEVYMREK